MKAPEQLAGAFSFAGCYPNRYPKHPVMCFVQDSDHREGGILKVGNRTLWLKHLTQSPNYSDVRADGTFSS